MKIVSLILVVPMIILTVIGAIIYGILRMNRRGEYDSTKNPFKILFYILAGVIGLLGILFITNFVNVSYFTRGHGEFLSVLPAMIIMPLFMLIPLTILILIGRFVYYDAQSRGMDPWLWLLVAIFVPNFIGLIIYLIVRNSYNASNKKCFNCGSYVREDYNICPNCGTNLKKTCTQCGRGVEKGWSMCPYCGNNLS
ncbi:hypothetical protein GCM10008905_21450 [Clostridium malenominatum]|uniref:DZANK-type domain-containing protein n=1 Tax=Clostridium malenominatum TaxID=1539 RepID=A0ABN1J1A0_9CLOT